MAEEIHAFDVHALASGLEAIIDAAADVLAASSLDATLRGMADALAPIVPYTSLAMYELDEPVEQLVPRFCVGSYVEETMRDRPPLDASISGRAVRERAVVISGPEDQQPMYITPGTPADTDEALVVAPLLVGGRPIGTLNVWRERVNPSFAPGEVRLVQRFATLAALAYVNARQSDVLREQARRDPLTGVFNRRHFERELEQAVAKPDLGGAVILFDVDEFKPINDRYGHPEGDRVLKELAATLQDCAGEEGAVFRVGGDEFAVLLPAMGREAATAWLLRTADAVARITTGMEKSMRASSGIAMIRRDDDVESIVRRADDGLLDAKRRR